MLREPRSSPGQRGGASGNSSRPSNAFTVTKFTEAEEQRIQQKLNSKLDKDDISYRPSAAGSVAYIEGWKSFNLANEIFGFNGWSSEILEFITDFMETDGTGRFSVGISCMDIGYGSSEGQKSKGASFEKAKKEAVTDAMKRALRVYGNRLGNCAYDKVFLREVKNAQSNNLPPKPPPAAELAKPAIAPNIPLDPAAKPPPNFRPSWTSAKSVLSPPSASTSMHQQPHHSAHHANPHLAHLAHDPNLLLHSDDFDALITEANLYDLEASTTSLDSVMMALDTTGNHQHQRT